MFLLLSLIACSGGAPSAPSTDPMDGHVMGVEGEHHEHGGMSEHMAMMNATRDRLRSELAVAYDQPVPGLDQADMSRGKTLYDQNCASCHGAAGKGDGPAGASLEPTPADFTDAFHARYYSDAGRVRIVEKGSPGTAMQAFEGQLDRQQILDVYAYVRSLRGAH